MNSMHVRDFSVEQVRNFVYDAVSGGASGVFSHVGRIMITQQAALRLKVFIAAAKHVADLIQDGIPRHTVKQYMLPVSQYI